MPRRAAVDVLIPALFGAAIGAALSGATGLPEVVALLFVCLAGLALTAEWIVDWIRGSRRR